MYWWWSQGVPTLGFPMIAYKEAAERVGYPEGLLAVKRPFLLFEALCAVAPTSTRTCLHAAALRGAVVSHPVYSAYELIGALCELDKACTAQESVQHGL